MPKPSRRKKSIAVSNGSKNRETLRNTGLSPVRPVPWGSHFCVFYQTKQDLLDILVPYFVAGIKQNEFCLWVVDDYEFVDLQVARSALRDILAPLDRLMKRRAVEIMTRQQLFPTGAEDLPEVIAVLRRRAIRAIEQGFAGMRVNGPSAGVRRQLSSRNFRQYEREVTHLIKGQRMIGISTLPLTFSMASEILEAAELHQFALTLRAGTWRQVEISDISAAEREIQSAVPKLAHLPPRQREILQRIAEGQPTKVIADMLGISVKTVEAHRVRLMRRLRIDNVPGLVRFAIRTGLVSAKA